MLMGRLFWIVVVLVFCGSVLLLISMLMIFVYCVGCSMMVLSLKLRFSLVCLVWIVRMVLMVLLVVFYVVIELNVFDMCEVIMVIVMELMKWMIEFDMCWMLWLMGI